MLKLNASYSKKVPAGEEYSSQSYHASVEVELPDGLSGEALQARIHETFDLVRNSVEAELHGNPQGGRSRTRSNAAPASPKQLSYLLDLARQRGITPQQIAARFQVPDIQHLTRQQCSDQIDEWRAA